MAMRLPSGAPTPAIHPPKWPSHSASFWPHVSHTAVLLDTPCVHSRYRDTDEPGNAGHNLAGAEAGWVPPQTGCVPGADRARHSHRGCAPASVEATRRCSMLMSSAAEPFPPSTACLVQVALVDMEHAALDDLLGRLHPELDLLAVNAAHRCHGIDIQLVP